MESKTEELLTTKQLSQKLGLAISTLLMYRAMGVGPAYVKIRRAVRYRPSVVNAWLDSQEKESAGA